MKILPRLLLVVVLITAGFADYFVIFSKSGGVVKNLNIVFYISFIIIYNLIFIVLLRQNNDKKKFSLLVFDNLAISWLLYSGGGVLSPFVMLYFLPIITAVPFSKNLFIKYGLLSLVFLNFIIFKYDYEKVVVLSVSFSSIFAISFFLLFFAFKICVADKMEKDTQKQKLRNRLDELERFQRVALGRELKMIELKKEIQRLKKKPSNSFIK